MINLDLAAASTENTFEVIVKQDEEDGSKAGFIVVSTMSEQYVKAKREMDIAGVRFARSKRGEKIDWKGSQGDEVIADQKAEANKIIAMNCVVDWFGFVVGQGDDAKPLEFSTENLDKVLKLFPAFADRIALEVQNDENFIRS